ncbi:MAG: TetR/AcrR family transcriptional regulator [Gemmatimonadaceae bacterium]
MTAHSKEGRSTDAEPSRRQGIVATAAGLFVRYGFRKTSMDDIARASKLSRQGLYLHFSNKEDVFGAVVTRLGDATLSAVRTSLEPDGRSLEARLVAAFASMTSESVGTADPVNVQELLAAAKELVGDIVVRLDDEIVSALAGALTQGRKRGARAARREPTPRALAELLYATSYGLKYRGHVGDDYINRMRVAIHVVCKSEEV